MTHDQRVPRQYTTCPLPIDASHGGVRAARAGCICHGAPDKLEAERARDRVAHSDRTFIRRTAREGADPVGLGGRAVKYPVATDAERRVRECDNLPCRDEDPELFFVVGDGPAADAQAAAAKRVCARCPVQADCLRAALEIGDRFSVRGATTPKERRQMRAQQIGAVA